LAELVDNASGIGVKSANQVEKSETHGTTEPKKYPQCNRFEQARWSMI
jgi:hypothetical protein